MDRIGLEGSSSSIRPAEFLQRHKVFLRRARDASHQALFFLGLLDRTDSEDVNEAVRCYQPFALYQVKALIRGVHLPDSYDQVAADLASGTLKPMDRTARELKRAVSLFHQWHVLFDIVKDPHSVIPGALRTDLIAFLRDSQEETLRRRLEIHWLPSLLSYLRKNLSLLWAMALVLALLLKVDAVNSLLRNERLAVLLPVLLLLAPSTCVWVLIMVLRRWRGTTPAWDISGPTFRSFRYQALEPGRLISRWSDEKGMGKAIFAGQMSTLLMFAFAWLLALGILCFLYSIDLVGGSSVTIFLVLSHFYVLLLLARSLDFWDYLDPRPVRFVLLLVGVLFLLGLLTGIGREILIVALPAAAIGYLSLSRQRGIFRWLVVLFLLAGAGASVWGRRTLEKEVWREPPASSLRRLGQDEWPWPSPPGTKTPVVIMAASGGGSRAAVYTGLTLHALQRDRPEIAEQLQAISSVSGGSLASAAYITRLFQTPNGSGQEQRRPLRTRVLGNLVSVLQTDFILPTLRGALMPGSTRAAAIEEDWRSGAVGLGEYRLSDLARRWRLDRKLGSPVPPFPLPLFNSSTLDGHNVVISPISKALYSRRDVDDEASDLERNAYHEFQEGSDLATWVYYRDGIYGLEDLLKSFDPPLSAAVRASANFPFGFPLVKVKTTRPLFFSPLLSDREPGKKKTVQLTDGGALSNSGMWSLFNLLMQPENLPRLRERGVLLILVEASRMPSYRHLDQAFNSLLGTIEDKGPMGQRLHRGMFELLERAYEDHIAIVQIDLVPQESYNVLTTWALDSRSLRQLNASFENRWKVESANLKQSWDELKALTAEQEPRARRPARRSRIPIRRPPLD